MFGGEDLLFPFFVISGRRETHSQFNFIMCRWADEKGERAKVFKSPVGKLVLLSLKTCSHFGVKDSGPDLVSLV